MRATAEGSKWWNRDASALFTGVNDVCLQNWSKKSSMFNWFSSNSKTRYNTIYYTYMESVWPFPMSEMVMIRFVEILGDTDLIKITFPINKLYSDELLTHICWHNNDVIKWKHGNSLMDELVNLYYFCNLSASFVMHACNELICFFSFQRYPLYLIIIHYNVYRPVMAL